MLRICSDVLLQGNGQEKLSQPLLHRGHLFSCVIKEAERTDAIVLHTRDPEGEENSGKKVD